MSRIRIAAVFGAAMLAVAACSGSAATPSSAPAASAAASTPAASAAAANSSAPASAACSVSSGAGTVSATIKNFSFSPNPVTAKVGEGITWTNQDSAQHTVSLDDGSCSSDRLSTNATVTLTFTAPGTYAFHCNVHPSMKGTIQVTG